MTSSLTRVSAMTSMYLRYIQCSTTHRASASLIQRTVITWNFRSACTLTLRSMHTVSVTARSYDFFLQMKNHLLWEEHIGGSLASVTNFMVVYCGNSIWMFQYKSNFDAINLWSGFITAINTKLLWIFQPLAIQFIHSGLLYDHALISLSICHHFLL